MKFFRTRAKVVVGRPADVICVGPEDDPETGGLTERDIQTIWKNVERVYKTGLYPAIQIALRRKGKLMLNRSLGHSHGNSPEDPKDAPKDLATTETLFNLFSASKLVTAMLIHLLDQRRQLHLDDRVSRYIPDFAQNGKEWVTIRHVLTHRSGIPVVPAKFVNVAMLSQPERIIELLCESKPTFAPGRRLAYHALTGGYILGEVIQRITGQTPREFLQSEISGPLGFANFNYGVAKEDVHRVAENVFTGPSPMPPVSIILKRALGVGLREAIDGSNDLAFHTAIIPAGNLTTTANEACLFMQMLMNGGELNGVRIFDRRTIQRATAEQSYLEMDFTLMLPIRYGMGFMLGSDYSPLFGYRSAHAFGHLGFTNVVMFADPERDIACSIMTSGKPCVAPGVLRALALTQIIAKTCSRDYGR